MLEYLRDSAKGWILKGLMVLIAASFVVWGVWGRDDSADDIGSVYGKQITGQEYSRAYEGIYNMFTRVNNTKLEGSFWKDLIGKQAVQSIIARKLQIKEANKFGIIVSDAELADRIHQQKMFQVDGQFNQELYKNILRANRLDMAEYESSFKNDIKLNKLREIITGAIFASEQETENEYRYANNKATIDYISLGPDYFKKLVKINEEDLGKFYAANKKSFMVQEKIEGEILVTNPEDFVKSIKPNDETIKAYYEKNLDKYYLPKRIKSRHILIKLAKDAEEKNVEEATKKGESILKELKAGKDFASLARKHSEIPSSALIGGDLGFIVKGAGMPKEFEDAAFTLKEGKTSHLVRTRHGLHIIKVEEIREEGIQPLEAMRPLLVEETKIDEAKKAARKTLTEIKNKERVNLDTFASIAQKNKLVRAKKVTLSKNDQLHPAIAGRAFALTDSKVSGVISENGKFYIVKINNKIDSFAPPLKDIRKRVEEAYRSQEWMKLAETKVPVLLERLQKGESLNAMANSLKTSKKKSEFVRRIDPIPALGNDSSKLLAKAFTVETNQFGSHRGQSGYFLFQVRGKLDAKMDDFNENKEALVVELTQQKRAKFYMEWLQKSMEQAFADGKVKIAKKYQ